MAEPVRIGLDGCVLPNPIDGTQEYLAAIFDELRALRTGSGPGSATGEEAPAPTEEPAPEPVLVSEPRSVAELIEEASEMGVPPEPDHDPEPEPAPKRARRTASSRKRGK